MSNIFHKLNPFASGNKNDPPQGEEEPRGAPNPPAALVGRTGNAPASARLGGAGNAPFSELAKRLELMKKENPEFIAEARRTGKGPLIDLLIEEIGSRKSIYTCQEEVVAATNWIVYDSGNSYPTRNGLYVEEIAVLIALMARLVPAYEKQNKKKIINKRHFRDLLSLVPLDVNQELMGETVLCPIFDALGAPEAGDYEEDRLTFLLKKCLDAIGEKISSGKDAPGIKCPQKKSAPPSAAIADAPNEPSGAIATVPDASASTSPARSQSTTSVFGTAAKTPNTAGSTTSDSPDELTPKTAKKEVKQLKKQFGTMMTMAASMGHTMENQSETMKIGAEDSLYRSQAHANVTETLRSSQQGSFKLTDDNRQKDADLRQKDEENRQMNAALRKKDEEIVILREKLAQSTAARESTEPEPASSSKKPASSSKKPAATAKKPAATAKKPAASAKKPAASAKKPAASTVTLAAGVKLTESPFGGMPVAYNNRKATVKKIYPSGKVQLEYDNGEKSGGNGISHSSLYHYDPSIHHL